MKDMKFKNRHDAALQLIPLLKKYANEQGVILAIPRGAVPMGYYIARELGLPLDILLSKKIGHPANPEVAVGSVSMQGRVIDPRFNMNEDYIENQTVKIRAMLQDRYIKFMGNRASIDLKDKNVIIVDDGIATGNTMLVSVDLVRNQSPKKVIIATPVASAEAVRKLKQKADEVVCLYIPEDFMAVGQFYHDFSQVSDEEVMHFLNELKAKG